MDIVERAEHYSTQYTEDGDYKLGSDKYMGTTRAVHIHGDHVYKAERCVGWGAAGCKAEWEFYTSTSDEVREHLCKPVYVSQNGRVVVMERIVPVDECDDYATDEIQSTMQALRECLPEKAFATLMCDVEYNDFNWGWKDGRIVLMDYGAIAGYVVDKQFNDRQNLRLQMGCVSI